MKLNFYTNCSLVRIPIKAGVTDYYFPTNVDWAGKKVDKMLFILQNEFDVSQYIYDPTDGQTPVIADYPSQTGNVFVSLYDADNREVMHNVDIRFLSQQNNAPLELNCVLNLSLCRVTLTTSPTVDYTLLCYVFHGTRTEEHGELPRRMVHASFALEAGQEISLRQIIHDYVHALPGRIKGIYCEGDTRVCYITLRDKKLTYIMDNIIGWVMRPINIAVVGIGRPINFSESEQKEPFLLNDLDVDFDNSYIRNGRNVKLKDCHITFLY